MLYFSKYIGRILHISANRTYFKYTVHTYACVCVCVCVNVLDHNGQTVTYSHTVVIGV